MSPSNREWLIKNGYAIIGLLAVSVSNYDVDEKNLIYYINSADTGERAVHVTLDDGVGLTSSNDGRWHNMLLIQEVLVRALDSVSKLTNLGFEVLKSCSDERNCFPTPVSYFANIVDVKNVSAVKHVLSINVPCHHCLDSKEEFKTISKEY